MNSFKTLIHCFELVSSLKVNWGRSFITGINSGQEYVSQLQNDIECAIGFWPIQYLGVPLGGNPRKMTFFESGHERCKKKLALLKANYLSFGGRITMIKQLFLIYQFISYPYLG